MVGNETFLTDLEINKHVCAYKANQLTFLPLHDCILVLYLTLHLLASHSPFAYPNSFVGYIWSLELSLDYRCLCISAATPCLALHPLQLSLFSISMDIEII